MINKVLIRGLSKNPFHRKLFPENKPDFLIVEPSRETRKEIDSQGIYSKSDSVYLLIMRIVNNEGLKFKIGSSLCTDDLLKNASDYLDGVDLIQ